MNDVELYTKETQNYNKLQHSRPDYVGAIQQVVQFASDYFEHNITLADFCCGTGSITKEIAERINGLHRAILIDINGEFLEIAKNSDIKASQLETKQDDIVTVKLNDNDADAVLSVFAYHHVPDQKKDAYVKQIKKILKPNGILLLAEIYSPDKGSTISYYENLFSAVPQIEQTPQLKKFLDETAQIEPLR